MQEQEGNTVIKKKINNNNKHNQTKCNSVKEPFLIPQSYIIEGIIQYKVYIITGT